MPNEHLELVWTACPPDSPAALLGGLCYGPAGETGLPEVAMARLGVPTPDLPLFSLFASRQPVEHARFGALRLWRHPDCLFAALSVEEDAYGEALSPLREASRVAYRTLFDALEKEGYSAPWRFWNYLADIHGDEAGLERYRQFNYGRQQAFADAGRSVNAAVPAACALGSQRGPLVVAVLAGREPALAIENPRQVSAYDYPSDYGPRAPAFARASVSWLDGRPQLWLSGTASIVGHRTLHAGDVAEQTRETLRNIRALLEETRRRLPEADFPLAALHYTVYLRHPEHQPLVAELLAAEVGAKLNAVYLKADVCRADLLVEIEASAGHPLVRLP
ncbi:hypothetical protein [Crenobacter cavernae]|uniref:Chorismatase FkbO/Hyg5-like N-terminal domain-containing protein n=1 Tax=Crenobacter cavernae TaxID=2290923 RepID=A0ABY0FCN7_9NEIS|nr:hypothetical protein [Crenobacter cavernae]RXZ43878.1 hypothetical protein EBB06_08365 [Crenobacter cavernae]